MAATEWARTDTGDMVFPAAGDDAAALTSDPGEVAKIKIVSVLEFVLAEWQPDTSLGFPWQQIWDQKNPNVGQLQALFRKAILAIQINGNLLVATVNDLSFSFDRTKRAVNYQLGATLVDGTQVSIP